MTFENFIDYLNLLIHDQELWISLGGLFITALAVIWDNWEDVPVFQWSLKGLHEKILCTRLNEEACTYETIRKEVNDLMNDMLETGAYYSDDIKFFFTEEFNIINKELETELPEQAIRLFKELRRLLERGQSELIKAQVLTA